MEVLVNICAPEQSCHLFGIYSVVSPGSLVICIRSDWLQQITSDLRGNQ